MTKKVIFFILFFVVITAGVIFFSKVKRTNNEVVVTTTPGNIFSKGTPTPQVISGDFPPLYPGVEWGEAKSGKYMFIDTKDETTYLNGIRTESLVDEMTSEKFMSYYNKLFTSQGWDKTLDAGGPPGIMFGYQKDNKFINFGVEYTPEGPGPGRKIVKYLIYLELSQ